MTYAYRREQLAQGCYATLLRWELNPRPPYRYATAPPRSRHYQSIKIVENLGLNEFYNATHGNLLAGLPRTKTITYRPRSFAASGAIVWNDDLRTTSCIIHHTRTVPRWTEDDTMSFGLQDMNRRFLTLRTIGEKKRENFRLD